MNLIQTPVSIVPEQSVIDSWPTKVRKASHLCQEQESSEITFDAERWIYERKNAYPMVDCLPGSAIGGWENFRYHPVCNGVVLKDQDVLVQDPNGRYSIKLEMTDEDKHLKNAIEAVRYAP